MTSSRGSSPPRDWTSMSFVSCTAGRSLYPLSHLGSPAGSYGNSIFSFLRNLHTVLAASTHISTNIVGRFPFLHTLLQHLLLGDFLMMSLWLMWSDILLQSWFAFFEKLAMWSIFSCTWMPSVCLLWSTVYLGFLCPFFDWVVFYSWVVWDVSTVWKLSPCWSHHLQILPLIL